MISSTVGREIKIVNTINEITALTRPLFMPGTDTSELLDLFLSISHLCFPLYWLHSQADPPKAWAHIPTAFTYANLSICLASQWNENAPFPKIAPEYQGRFSWFLLGPSGVICPTLVQSQAQAMLCSWQEFVTCYPQG